ncbi:MAG: Kdo hydroxylase family protein [Legionellaceae bacterium]|nr:Kdo hydroxylase family protein [Legionellaceae bacterium]
MTTVLHTVSKAELSGNVALCTSQCLQALEEGKVIFLPEHTPAVSPQMRPKLEANILDGKHKNLSFDVQRQTIGGLNPLMKGQTQAQFLLHFMNDFANYAKGLVTQILPFYQEALIWGRTSYRPAEIAGRPSSKRKDDTRLHVDAFPASPVHGKRILRVFSNINFDGKARLWHLGEAFPEVLQRFYSDIPPYRRAIAHLMHWLKATKSVRSAYDHIMLQLHDRMKCAESYQQNVAKIAVDFPAMSSWLVFTDQVSHAALGGQYLLEQTFYVPVEAMARPELSPYRQIQSLQNRGVITHSESVDSARE